MAVVVLRASLTGQGNYHGGEGLEPILRPTVPVGVEGGGLLRILIGTCAHTQTHALQTCWGGGDDVIVA